VRKKAAAPIRRGVVTLMRLQIEPLKGAPEVSGRV